MTTEQVLIQKQQPTRQAPEVEPEEIISWENDPLLRDLYQGCHGNYVQVGNTIGLLTAKHCDPTVDTKTIHIDIIYDTFLMGRNENAPIFTIDPYFNTNEKLNWQRVYIIGKLPNFWIVKIEWTLRQSIDFPDKLIIHVDDSLSQAIYEKRPEEGLHGLSGDSVFLAGTRRIVGVTSHGGGSYIVGNVIMNDQEVQAYKKSWGAEKVQFLGYSAYIVGPTQLREAIPKLNPPTIKQ